jgi:hypothetical protein
LESRRFMCLISVISGWQRRPAVAFESVGNWLTNCFVAPRLFVASPRCAMRRVAFWYWRGAWTGTAYTTCLRPPSCHGNEAVQGLLSGSGVTTAERLPFCSMPIFGPGHHGVAFHGTRDDVANKTIASPRAPRRCDPASGEDIGSLRVGHACNLRVGESTCLTGCEATDGGGGEGVDLVGGHCHDLLRG